MADAPKLLGTDTLRTAYPKVNQAIDNANEALRNSEEALNTANQALANSENTQAQLDQIVIEGDSSVEAAQARVDADGNVFTTLKERLDTKETQFANEIGILNKKTDSIVSVKEFGAKGDGVTDDTLAIQNALNQNGTVVFESGKTYLVTDCLLIGDNIKKIDGCSAKIIFTREQQGSSSSTINSLFNAFDRKSSLAIENIVLQYIGTFDFGYSYAGLVNGIDIRSSNGFSGLYIKNVEAFGFNRAGIQIAYGGAYINNVVIESCYLHHNRVAGVWYGNVDGIILRGNRCEYNGIATDAQTGYGMAGIGDFYPKNIRVINNICNNNYRKGIDFHSGYNIYVEGNICDGNRYWGIYAVTKNYVNNQVQPTGFIHIKNNVIKNMSNDSTTNPPLTEIFGIAVGKSYYGEGTNSGYKTNVLIQGNTITNLDVQNASNGHVIFITSTGFENLDVSIVDNQINVQQVDTFVRFQDDTTITGGQTNAKISGNIIKIKSAKSNPFFVRSGANLRKLDISNNNLEIKDPYTLSTLCNFADTDPTNMFPDAVFTFRKNVLTINKTDWGNYDPVAVYGKNYIFLSDNIFNGVKYRDYDGTKYINKGNAPPTSGTWLTGSIIFNTSPTAGGNIGWVCIATGQPGTWKTFGAIST